ncbi:MAG: ribosome biogenesis GTPase Der [Deltaproteobacteria bacterium]
MTISETQEKVSEKKPIVAIVGRPNVGKSTLFNRILGWNKSIVEDIPGVTRDRLYGDAEWGGIKFTVVDTGGLDPATDDFYLSLIKKQVETAIDEADVIVFVLDGKTGVMPQDTEVLEALRKIDKPVVYAVNKIDHESHEVRALEFHSIGIEDFINVSAGQGRNLDELLDAVVERLPMGEIEIEPDDEEGTIRVAVVGKPNVGKSTLINKILGEDRLLTSPLPGTTRDAVDTLVQRDGRRYIFIDTAGMRRKPKVTFSVEQYSVLRTIKSIERADVAVFMLDAQDGPTHQDGHLAEMIRKKNKGCVILLNKWDLVPQEVAETPGIEDIARGGLKEVDFASVLLVSALTGRRVDKLFGAIDAAYKNYASKIPTRVLNDLLKEILRHNPPPVFKGSVIKFYYITQPMTKPPTFVVFTNRINGIPENYKRFLENKFREEFKLDGTPLKFIFRESRHKV